MKNWLVAELGCWFLPWLLCSLYCGCFCLFRLLWLELSHLLLSALNHEASEDPVECCAIVYSLLDEIMKLRGGDWLIVSQLEGYVSQLVCSRTFVAVGHILG